MSRRVKRRGNFLFILGFMLILAALILTLYNVREADQADQAAQDAVQKMVEEIEEEFPEQKESEEELPSIPEMKTMEIDGYEYIGYLSIPATNQLLPVMAEWDYDRLKIAPCLYYGSYYTDDLVIAGHNYRRHFSPLRYLDRHTEVDFIDVENNVYRYEISHIEILNPEQTKDLVSDPDSQWDLTLFTCTIGGQTRHTIRLRRIDRS